MRAVTVLACAAMCTLCSCHLGEGEGWVRGKLWMQNCKGGLPLGGSLAAPDMFDLRADFFAGEPQDDANPSVPQRANRLTIRIQNTSNNIEVSDGLLLQFDDLVEAARKLATGELIDISNASLCEDRAVTWCKASDAVRATLYLHASCKDSREALLGVSYQMVRDPNQVLPPGETCLAPMVGSSGELLAPLPCGSLAPSERQQLDSLCAQSFSDPQSADSVQNTLQTVLGPRGACAYMCELGSARPGLGPLELDGFHVDFGDHVAALVSLPVVDGRSVRQQSCARATGMVFGAFRFEIMRGRAAQAFP